MATAAFGIDFGTTNTRVAYFNGEAVQIVQFTTSEGTVSQLPTAVAYQHGRPVAFGTDAQTLPTGQGTLFPKPLKWLLRSPEPVEVGDGQTRDPGDVVSDFLKNLKDLVARALPRAPLDRAAVTIPVHYPTDARRRLALAFREAGIGVTNYFYEPIAALYASAAGDPASGTAAVFDWGGGSLDVAAVELRDGMALTR
jgi:molecular chaperone DnaK (HSP70)